MHDGDLAEREERLGEICSDWLECAERGEAPDREEWLARHPEFAPELEEFLADAERVRVLAAPLREAARAARLDTPRPWEADPARSAPGSLGEYELLEEIGKGGMGVVYRARQKGLNRFVALKLFRPDPLGQARDLQRFRNEAELVAQLDHPNIVPIYEVGEHAEQPYFSMKLIEGGSLATFLRSVPESGTLLRSVAKLMATVARAVHHAHQRGILHRDLKPSNILLDSDGQPHVTDFGLAKRLDPGREAQEILTHSGAVVGTPAYMAPEQAVARNGAVTTAADVYGLGAVLYALLTGQAPFQGGSVLETLAQVEESDPEPPGRINPKVPRDLETICLKCLQKEPERRYASAQALAEDLDRWLRGEPIQARPTGRLEALLRWCRRQPVQAALAAALFLALAIGVPLVVWQWLRADDNFRQAEGLRREAVGHEAEVEDSFRLANEVVGDFTMRVGDAGLLEAHGLDPLRRELLEKAQRYYRKLLARRGHDPALRGEIAQATASLAAITRQIGDPEEALAAYERAIEMYADLSRESPDDLSLRIQVARLHNHKAGVLTVLDRRDEELDALRRAQELLEEALRTWPDDLRIQHELANTHHNVGMAHTASRRVEDALAAFREARTIHERLLRARPDDPDFLDKHANTLNSAGVVLHQDQRAAEALEFFQEAVALRERLFKRSPDNLGLQYALAMSLSNLGDCLRDGDQPEEGLKRLRRASNLLERLTIASPHVTAYRFQLASTRAAIGHAQLKAGRLPQALDTFELARPVFEQLVREQPKVTEPQRLLDAVYLDVAEAHFHLRQDEQAVRALEQARDIELTLIEAQPNQAEPCNRLGMTLYNMSLSLGRMGRLEDARSVTAQAAERMRQALDKAPREARYRHGLSGAYSRLAQLNWDVDRHDEAREATQKRLALYPSDPGELYGIACDLSLTAGRAQDETRRRIADLAVEALRRAVKAGFRDADRARTDGALDLLRSRDDFSELLRRMNPGPQKENGPS
jgi:serine/threonine-protein kinase